MGVRTGATVAPCDRARAPRLVLVLPTFDQGGAERVLVAIGRELAGRGVDVRLVFLGDEARVPAGATFPVQALGARAPLIAIPRLARVYRERRPDAVLATLVGANAIAVAAARLVPRASRPRVIVREANTLPIALDYRPFVERTLARAVARFAYPRADGIVAVSDAAADALARFLPLPRARVHAIPNPAWAPARQKHAELTHPFAARTSTAPLLVAAGRLVPKKGFDVLLRAFATLADGALVILGEGPERGRLEALARALGVDARVAFPGFVDDPFPWFARADLFVLSSYAEGMPNVLLQAIASGCPVVSTDCPSGPREILGDDAPFLVPPGDPVALGRALAGALALPRADLAAVATARAERFALPRITSAYAEVLGLDAATASVSSSPS